MTPFKLTVGPHALQDSFDGVIREHPVPVAPAGTLTIQPNSNDALVVTIVTKTGSAEVRLSEQDARLVAENMLRWAGETAADGLRRRLAWAKQEAATRAEPETRR